MTQQEDTMISSITLDNANEVSKFIRTIKNEYTSHAYYIVYTTFGHMTILKDAGLYEFDVVGNGYSFVHIIGKEISCDWDIKGEYVKVCVDRCGVTFGINKRKIQ